MKLSPLFLFLLVLFIFVISVVVCKNCFRGFSKKEGFVSFEANASPVEAVTIPQYATNHEVIKMYDNVFFDQQNGNMIEVDSTTFNGNVAVSGNLDTTGDSISNIYVSGRDGTTTSYATASNNTVNESSIASISSSYNTWNYTTKCTNTPTYQAFYMPWSDSTHVHIIQLKDASNASYVTSKKSANNDNKHKISLMFGGSASVPIQMGLHVGYKENIKSLSADTDTNNNTYVTDPYYDPSKNLYQLSKYVKFDASNGNLVIRSDNSITVIDRDFTKKTYNQPGQIASTSNNISTSAYAASLQSDNYQNTILYVASGQNTLVALFQLDDSSKYKLFNIGRFTVNGLDKGDSSSKKPADASQNVPPPLPADMSANNISDYYKWYWYWNTVANPTTKQSEDYILKTQIVPPVCPACPNCPSTGSCANCGGQGGSGTLDSQGNSVVQNGNSVGGVLNNVVSTTGQVVSDTVGGAIDLTKSAGSEVVNLTEEAGSEVVGLAKTVGSDITSIANKTVGTIGNIFTDGQNTQSYGQSGPSGPAQNGTNPVDHYSYYGALPSKGANFMPITADFSAFGK